MTTADEQTDVQLLRNVATMIGDTGWHHGDAMGMVQTRLRAIADRLEARQAAQARWVDPPHGWYTFGTHASWSPVPPMEFSDELDVDGDPMFERPIFTDQTLGYMVAGRVDTFIVNAELAADLAGRLDKTFHGDAPHRVLRISRT